MVGMMLVELMLPIHAHLLLYGVAVFVFKGLELELLSIWKNQTSAWRIFCYCLQSCSKLLCQLSGSNGPIQFGFISLEFC